MSLRERLEALCEEWESHGTPDQRGCAHVIRALLAAHPDDAAQEPPGDRVCHWGCGTCRWEPGPWHQMGCPSYRAGVPDEATGAARRRADFVAGYVAGGTTMLPDDPEEIRKIGESIAVEWEARRFGEGR